MRRRPVLSVAVSLLASAGLSTLPSAPAFFAAVGIALVVIWCVRITPKWVRTAAFAYAERLVGISETFPPPESGSKIIAQAH